MIPIFDGHNDMLLSLIEGERGQNVTFFDKSDKGHLDFPRAKKAGFAGGFFAIYSPSEGFDLEAHMTATETGYTMLLSPPRDQQKASRLRESPTESSKSSAPSKNYKPVSKRV